jgi:signal peptidase I
MRTPLDRLPRRWRLAADWLLTIAAAVAFVLAFEAEVAKPFRVPTSSMEPTLHCAKPGMGCRGGLNDRVIVDRISYLFHSPHRGDIVAFQTPPATLARCGAGGVFIKRIVGLPGEVVSEQNGRVFIDGRALAERYLQVGARDAQTHTWPRIPAHSYFMLGDNRTLSCDSRVWGTVDQSRIIGRALVTYWPPDRFSFH